MPAALNPPTTNNFPPITPNAEFACAFGELAKAAHTFVAGSYTCSKFLYPEKPSHAVATYNFPPMTPVAPQALSIGIAAPDLHVLEDGV